MATMTVLEVQARLPNLIREIRGGAEVEITENGVAVAKLVPLPCLPRKVPRLGTQPGSVLHMAADFDAPLEEFKEYME